MNPNQYFTRSLFLLLFLGAFPFSAFGQQISVKNNDLVTRLIHKLHLDLASPQKGVKQLLNRNFFNLPEQKNQKLMQAFEKGYDNTRILDAFKDSLQKKMTPDLRTKISAWLDQPSTQAVTQANKQYNTLQGKRKRVIAMYKTDQNPPESERKRILINLWNAMADLLQTTPVSMIIFRSMIKAYGNLDDNQHFSEARINTIIQNYKTQVLLPSAKAARKKGIHNLAVKYYEVKTTDLKAYTSFFASDAGQLLIKAIDKSMLAAYKAGSQRFLNLVKKSITQ